MKETTLAPAHTNNLEESNSVKVDASTELSMRRTGMSFQRTRLSADRTLMSVIRTSLSLISFGFTIYKFFRAMRDANVTGDTSVTSARNFGLTLIVIGIGLLIFGLMYHLSFMKALRQERNMMVEEGLIHGDSPYPVSLVVIVALVMLAVGSIAAIEIVVGMVP